MNEPIRAIWADGQRKAGLPLVLFWLGAASVLASAVIGLQLWAVPRMSDGLSSLALLIPAWGLIAMVLAILWRKNIGGLAVTFLSAGWLLIALAFVIWVRRNHV